MNTEKLVNQLFDLADEACARELTNNQAYEKFGRLSWEELCNEIILVAAALKRRVPVDIEILKDEEHYGYYDSIEDAITDLIVIDEQMRPHRNNMI